MNEISFNAVLLKELRMIAVLRQVLDPGSGEGRQWARMRIHRIEGAVMGEAQRIPRSSTPSGRS